MGTAALTQWRTEVIEAARSRQVVLRQDVTSGRGPGFIRAQLAARRWQAFSAHVLVLHNGPLTNDQRTWVALLASPPGSMLHGLSAAVPTGLKGFDPDGLHVVVPGDSRSRRCGIHDLPVDWRASIRWSTKLGPEDVNDVALPPRTRLSRSIVDAASERVAERRARAIVLASVQQRLTVPAALWDALSRRGRCRNRAIIAESIVDATGGIQSLPEHEFSQICRHVDLPRPGRQRVLQTRGGRFYLDSDWPDWGVRTEVHGLPHREIPQWDQDLLRQNDIAIAGAGLLVFSSYAIRHQSDQVARQLLAMFETRGWRPRNPAQRSGSQRPLAG